MEALTDVLRLNWMRSSQVVENRHDFDNNIDSAYPFKRVGRPQLPDSVEYALTVPHFQHSYLGCKGHRCHTSGRFRLSGWLFQPGRFLTDGVLKSFQDEFARV